VPDYSEYEIFKEWILWLLAACAFLLADAAVIFSMMRSTVTRLAAGLALVLALATIAAGVVLTVMRRADCDRELQNKTWAMHAAPIWHDDHCPTEALGSAVLSLELAALPLLMAAGVLWRARRLPAPPPAAGPPTS